MHPLFRLLCLLGRHRRSRGHARRLTDRWLSRCKTCGVPMEKIDGGRWQVVTPGGEPPPGIASPVAAADPPRRRFRRKARAEPAAIARDGAA